MKIGIQTRLWGTTRHKNQLPEILAEVSASGYQGIEIGIQHLDRDQPELFSKMVAGHGLQVVSLHVAGQYDQPHIQMETLGDVERIIAFAARAGSQFITVSGFEKIQKTEHEIQAYSENLNQIGATCRDYGLQLCYHNHYWEILEACRELHLLCEQTDPSLVALCLDVGWVQRTGEDALHVSRMFSKRIGYMHFRDSVRDAWSSFGQGRVDFGALVELAGEKRNAWVVIEQEPPATQSEQKIFEIARDARECITKLMQERS